MITVFFFIYFTFCLTIRSEGWDEWLASLLASLAVGSLLGVISAFIIGLFPASRLEVSAVRDLAALQDSRQTEGRFFLGSGRIEDRAYYYFYRRVGQDSYVMDKIGTDEAVIVQDEESNPHMTEYARTFINPRWSYFAFTCACKPIEFHVPKGSILQNFRLDLQ